MILLLVDRCSKPGVPNLERVMGCHLSFCESLTPSVFANFKRMIFQVLNFNL